MDVDVESLLAGASPEARAELVRLGREECWRHGNLRWKLDSNQQGIYDQFYASRGRFVLECARRLGKTYWLSVIAVEMCLRKSRSRVVYAAQTLKEVAEFVVPTIEAIAEDAPDDARPTYNGQTGHWDFPNGSVIALFGCDDKRKANRGRGPGADLGIVDEGGFIPILKYVVKSIIRPQLLTTGGRLLVGSSPSDEPEHEFTEMCEQAEANGNLANRTIFDNPRLTPERIAEFLAEDASDDGMTIEEYKQTDTYKREHLAMRVVDKTLVVMGEDWTTVREQARIEVERPLFFDGYEALDMGGVDPHGVLFGYWHFEKSWLVIEDELLLRDGENTEQLAERIRAKEAELWGIKCWDGSLKAIHEERADEVFMLALPEWARAKVKASMDAPAQPYLRVCDNDVQIARDLSMLHGITYLPTQKTDKRWYVNEFRILCRQGRVKIHPRCRNLDRHLRQTVWANHRVADYKRKNGEHGDLLDCAVYMARNIRKSRNPVPHDYGRDKIETFTRARPPENQLKRLVGLRKVK